MFDGISVYGNKFHFFFYAIATVILDTAKEWKENNSIMQLDIIFCI